MELKISIFLIFGCLANLLATPSYSQIAKVSLDLQNAKLEQVLDEIEKQSEFYFVFNQKQIDIDRVVDIHEKNKLITEILPDLFQGTGVNYLIFNKKILLTTDSINYQISKTTSETGQQRKNITGTVIDKNGSPVVGANIIVTGTSVGATTDLSGKYSIEVPDGSKSLTFSFIGMIRQEINIGTSTIIDVTMAETEVGLDEVVIVGYGTQKKASLTGSVLVVKVPEIKDQAIANGNIVKALDGRLPGAVISYDGNPNGVANILIRGQGSLNSSTAPLIIIDGVPTNRGLNEITPNDIESVQVLKDASAATIYGSRAANGVYIITTKSANKGTKLEISSSLTAGFLPHDPIPLMNTEQHGRAQWMAARNDGVDPNYGVYSFEDHQENGRWVLDRIILPEYLDDAHTMKPANTDWQKVISRTALSQDHSVIFSNGGDHGNALLSFDYLHSAGTTKYNEWNKFNIRLNSDYKLFKNHFKIGENIALIKMRYTGDNWLGNTTAIQSIIPVHTIDGKGWGGPVQGMSDRNNVLLDIMRNRQNYSADLRLVGSAFTDVELIKDLHFRSTFGTDYDGNWAPTSTLKYQAGFMQETTTKLTTSASFGGSWTWNNVLNYGFTLADNNINLMVGQEATRAHGENLWGARDGFAIEDPNYLYLDVGEGNVRNGGLAYTNSQNSYFGRINYDYKRRFLFTGIMRRDGSSRFGANNRYAFFPSFSAGWTISEESFMKSIQWISNLKIRYGWGKTGNQEIDNYASYAQYQANYSGGDYWHWEYSTSAAYDIYGMDQGNLPSGYTRLQLGNPNLKWEACTQNNFGLDFGLFSSKLVGSFDYYIKTTSDILVKPPTLLATGNGAGRWINGANMKNWGYEFTLSYSDRTGDLVYNLSFNAFHNTNRFVYIVPEAVGAYPGNGRDQTILGRPLNSLYGYVVSGIFQNETEVESAADQPGKGVGRLRFKDVNHDGKIDADDRTWIGVNEPKFSWGLNGHVSWKNFDMTMFWVSEIGRDISSVTKGFVDFFGFFGGQNYGTRVLNCWSPTNTKSTIPAITAADINNEQRFSTYFVERTNYLKLQSMTVGYSIPETISKKISLEKARIFGEVNNMWTIKLPGNTFTGYDSKYPTWGFPLPISVTFGVNLTF